MRICPKCTKEKTWDNYTRNRSSKTGHNSWCKECEGNYRKEIGSEKIRIYRQKTQKHYAEAKSIRTQERKLLAYKKLGNKCADCNFSDIRALQIDHKDDDGKNDRMLGNRAAFYQKVIEDTTGRYQLLCANCNWIKRHEKYYAKQLKEGIESCLKQ